MAENHRNKKSALPGASTTGTLALTAATMFPDITLTIAMTPSDFVWQGFMQGKKDGCKEWPVEGESLFSYAGKPLPYMPFCYQHPDYWHCIAAESKRTGDMVNSRKLFDDSEAAHPIEPEEYIPVENIHGKLLLMVGKERGGNPKKTPREKKTPKNMNARLRRWFMPTAPTSFFRRKC